MYLDECYNADDIISIVVCRNFDLEYGFIVMVVKD